MIERNETVANASTPRWLHSKPLFPDILPGIIVLVELLDMYVKGITRRVYDQGQSNACKRPLIYRRLSLSYFATSRSRVEQRAR